MCFCTCKHGLLASFTGLSLAFHQDGWKCGRKECDQGVHRVRGATGRTVQGKWGADSVQGTSELQSDLWAESAWGATTMPVGACVMGVKPGGELERVVAGI